MWLHPNRPKSNRPKSIRPKTNRPKKSPFDRRPIDRKKVHSTENLYFRNFRHFAVGIRPRCQRRVFAPYQDLFRTVEKTEKFQPQAKIYPETCLNFQNISKYFLVHSQCSPLSRLQCCRHVFAPFQKLFRAVEKTKKIHAQPKIQP